MKKEKQNKTKQQISLHTEHHNFNHNFILVFFFFNLQAEGSLSEA